MRPRSGVTSTRSPMYENRMYEPDERRAAGGHVSGILQVLRDAIGNRPREVLEAGVLSQARETAHAASAGLHLPQRSVAVVGSGPDVEKVAARHDTEPEDSRARPHPELRDVDLERNRALSIELAGPRKRGLERPLQHEGRAELGEPVASVGRQIGRHGHDYAPHLRNRCADGCWVRAPRSTGHDPEDGERNHSHLTTPQS